MLVALDLGASDRTLARLCSVRHGGPSAAATRAQLDALHEFGCALVQGYLLGRPVPPEQIVPPLGVPA